MIKRTATTIIAAFIFCSALSMAARAATLSPALKQQVSQLPDNTSLGIVIVAFRTDSGLAPAHLDVLRGVGISGGYTLQNLGMVAVNATVAQVKALSANQSVRSVWSN